MVFYWKESTEVFSRNDIHNPDEFVGMLHKFREVINMEVTLGY
jgi:hypothetical protein